jgi:hypothetical protein
MPMPFHSVTTIPATLAFIDEKLTIVEQVSVGEQERRQALIAAGRRACLALRAVLKDFPLWEALREPVRDQRFEDVQVPTTGDLERWLRSWPVSADPQPQKAVRPLIDIARQLLDRANTEFARTDLMARVAAAERAVEELMEETCERSGRLDQQAAEEQSRQQQAAEDRDEQAGDRQLFRDVMLVLSVVISLRQAYPQVASQAQELQWLAAVLRDAPAALGPAVLVAGVEQALSGAQGTAHGLGINEAFAGLKRRLGATHREARNLVASVGQRSPRPAARSDEQSSIAKAKRERGQIENQPPATPPPPPAQHGSRGRGSATPGRPGRPRPSPPAR